MRVEIDGRMVKLSNLDKVLYPQTGTTKGEVLDYYARVAPAILRQLRDRAVTRVRWPHGTGQANFFEKNAPAGTPSWVRTVTVPTSGSRTADQREGTLTFPVADDLATLTWMANLAALELHVHQWRVDDSGEPVGADRIVIDLDPGAPAGLQECSQVALLVRDTLAGHGLTAIPVLSGSKGLHLYATLPAPAEPEVATGIAKAIADGLEVSHPRLVTATMTKARRAGKVFVDWSQNSGSKTTLAPWSLRGGDRPTAAAPVSWAEVEAGAEDPLGLEQMDFREVVRRLETFGDPFDQANDG
ncbi:non-homologous end-joining DNA ligase [Nocardioides baekrokdamisoli]|nr:non-homologous end-joining DNA ligase [Nocardioides baekrokdamisoli]